MDEAIVKLSFIIPVYNKEKLLESCVNSILNITQFPYEIILVDDGSTDGSYKICQELSAEYDHVHAIAQKNQGVSVARNTGIKAARGMFITFVDADDFVKERFGQEVADALMTAADYYKFNYTRWISDAQQSEGRLSLAPGYYEDLTLWVTQVAGLEICAMCVWSSIYKREIIEQNDIQFKPGMKTCEDFQFNMDYLQHIKSFFVSDGTGYCYRDNPDSVTNNRPLSHSEDYADIYQTIINYLQQQNADAASWNLLYRRFIRWSIDLVYSWRVSNIAHELIWKSLEDKNYYKDIVKFEPNSYQEKLEKYFLQNKQEHSILLYNKTLTIVRKLIG